MTNDKEYQHAAEHISSLRKQFVKLDEEYSQLQSKVVNLVDANHYMNQLIKVIKHNPVVLDAWKNFLAVANIIEPSWKNEYE